MIHFRAKGKDGTRLLAYGMAGRCTLYCHGNRTLWEFSGKFKVSMSFEPRHEKICFWHMQTTKAQISLHNHPILSDQHFLFAVYIVKYLYLLKPKFQDLCIHPVWSALFVGCLGGTIPILATAKISRLYLASVAEQAGLSLTWLQTLKTGFLVWRLFCKATVMISSAIFSNNMINALQTIIRVLRNV